MNKKLIKKTVYYIFLTIAFLILPFSIRNIYLSIIIKTSLIDLIINVLAGVFIFLYPLSIALLLRYNLKYNKWPIKYDDESSDEKWVIKNDILNM